MRFPFTWKFQVGTFDFSLLKFIIIFINRKQNSSINNTTENPAFDDINSPIPVHKNPPLEQVQAAPIVATTQRYNEGQSLDVPRSDFYSPPGTINR